jgi:NAD(P)-dependent dehydrogenase (short-subunit alcohol dehydrogenase family)
MDLNGISAIVTGGASGLGAATATRLAERGARVVLADLERQQDKGEPLAKELGGLFVACDVTDTDQIVGAIEAAKDMGPLRALVTAAGMGWATRTIGKDGQYGSAHDLGVFQTVININLVGTFNCIRLAATAMSQTRRSTARSGRPATRPPRVAWSA